MELLNVSAVIVTRGDVALEPVLSSLPEEWERLVWDNSFEQDLAVYGRYAAIERFTTPLVFVQDDDVLLPRESVEAIIAAWQPDHVVCNMPQEFRPHYPDSALVGFGACFERELPQRAFMSYESWPPGPRMTFAVPEGHGAHWRAAEHKLMQDEAFLRECDTVFTTLTPRILVDVPKTDRDFASDPNRLWKQPEHNAHRARMLELARMVRDS